MKDPSHWPRSQLASPPFFVLLSFLSYNTSRGRNAFLVYVEVDSHLGVFFRLRLGEQKYRHFFFLSPHLCQFFCPEPPSQVSDSSLPPSLSLFVTSQCLGLMLCLDPVLWTCRLPSCLCLVSTVCLLLTFILTSLRAFVPPSRSLPPQRLQHVGLFRPK